MSGENTSNIKHISAGHLGARATHAKSYWDQLLSIEDAALLLKMRVTAIKEAVCDRTLIHGLPAPKPVLNENDKMFFNGRDIEKLVLAKHITGKEG